MHRDIALVTLGSDLQDIDSLEEADQSELWESISLCASDSTTSGTTSMSGSHVLVIQSA